MIILVVEDSVRLANLMTKLLVENGHTVDLAGNLDEARAALKIVEYDLIILDLSLPDGDGRDIINAVRHGRNNTLVIVVTARGDVVSRVQALNAGADDYVVKPVDGDELIARVRALGRRSGQIRSEVINAGNISLDSVSMTLKVGGRLSALPPRELRALSVLLQSQGQVLRREKLEHAIYAFDDDVSENALEATVSRLRRRLESLGATVDIVAMRGIGYVLSERVA